MAEEKHWRTFADPWLGFEQVHMASQSYSGAFSVVLTPQPGIFPRKGLHSVRKVQYEHMKTVASGPELTSKRKVGANKYACMIQGYYDLIHEGMTIYQMIREYKTTR